MAEKKRQSNVIRNVSLRRVLELIKRLDEGKTVCIDNLLCDPLWMDLSERTIRRDLGLINEVYPKYFLHIDGTSGCYKAMTKKLFGNIVSPERMALIFQTFKLAERNKLYDNLKISDIDARLIDKLIKKSEKYYLFKNKPFENHLANIELFHKLRNAISYRQELKILFPLVNGGDTEILIKPYKILFMNENFYLASVRSDGEQEFARYRISRILSVEKTSKTFKQDFEMTKFIDAIQTPFAKYQPSFEQYLIKVTLEADSDVARYFHQKKYLPSQKEMILPNGNLRIEYIVTDEREVESIIKRWIPLVKVIEPLSLKQKIQDDLKTYLKHNA